MKPTSHVGNSATSKLLEQRRCLTVPVPKLRLASAERIRTALLHSDGAVVCQSFRVQRMRAALLPLLSLEYSGEGINSDFAVLRAVGGFLRGSAEAY